MKLRYNDKALYALSEAPVNIRKAFYKHAAFLVENLSHPSFHAKKYSEAQNKWQARVNRDWRFYVSVRQACVTRTDPP